MLLFHLHDSLLSSEHPRDELIFLFDKLGAPALLDFTFHSDFVAFILQNRNELLKDGCSEG